MTPGEPIKLEPERWSADMLEALANYQLDKGARSWQYQRNICVCRMKNDPVIGFLEVAGSIGFVGWAYQPGSLEPLQLNLFIDGRLEKTFFCDGFRQDVAAYIHDLSEHLEHERVGFSIEIPPSYFDDSRHFFEFVDADGFPVTLIPLGDCAINPGEFCLPSKEVLGNACASLADMRIAGWVVVVDRQTSNKRVVNEIEVSNAQGEVFRIQADIKRPDVAKTMNCEPECGFEALLPQNFITKSSHQLFVTVLPEQKPLTSIKILSDEDQGVTSNRSGGSAVEESRLADAAASTFEEDEPRIRTTAFASSEVFGSTCVLSDLRSKVLPSWHVSTRREYDGDIERLISAEFDADFYLAVYKDVAAAGIDPLMHFVVQGWREGRRPTAWFDTAYYLDANPDIKAAGVNPFWHYLVVGRQEGRRTVRVGGRRRTTLENVVDPRERTRHYKRMTTISKLFKDRLVDLIRSTLAEACGFVMSLSQDCYIEAIGGIQLFIGDEQRGYAQRGYSYLNVSPIDPDLVLAVPSSRAYYRLVLNGKYIGISSHNDLIEALGASDGVDLAERVFIVHCLLGHNVDRTIELAKASTPTHRVFWLHDYSAICPGYNLLRNDVEYCGAPSVDSVCCRICVYGELRPEHLGECRKLFESVPFIVVAPSKAALDIWLAASDFPYRRAVVHGHCILEETSVRVTDSSATARGLPENPLRIAFIGHPASHKGWPTFEELVSKVTHLPCYRFFHFVSGGDQFVASVPVERVEVQTTADHRDAMTRALAMNSIDLVLMLAPWPETFSYVTFEAMAAGADVIAFDDSGNVADTILQLGRGIVVEDESALFELFTSLRIVLYVRMREEQSIVAGLLVHLGTTSTLRMDI